MNPWLAGAIGAVVGAYAISRGDRLRRGAASIQARLKATANTLTAATTIIANSKEPNSMVPPLATAVRPSLGAPLIKQKNSEGDDKARRHHHGNEELPHPHFPSPLIFLFI